MTYVALFLALLGWVLFFFSQYRRSTGKPYATLILCGAGALAIASYVLSM